MNTKDKISFRVSELFGKALNAEQKNGVVVSNYKGKIVQITVSEDKENAVIQVGKVIPPNVTVRTDTIEELNELDDKGKHLVVHIKNTTRCYIYRTEYDFAHLPLTEDGIREYIDLYANKADAGYRLITVKA